MRNSVTQAISVAPLGARLPAPSGRARGDRGDARAGRAGAVGRQSPALVRRRPDRRAAGGAQGGGSGRPRREARGRPAGIHRLSLALARALPARGDSPAARRSTRRSAFPARTRPARLAQFARNYDGFGAPVLLFFSIDRLFDRPQWAHLGMFMQNLMLLAEERGLATCPQEAWAAVHGAVAEHLGAARRPDPLLRPGARLCRRGGADQPLADGSRTPGRFRDFQGVLGGCSPAKAGAQSSQACAAGPRPSPGSKPASAAPSSAARNGFWRIGRSR